MKTQIFALSLLLFGWSNSVAQAPSYTDFEWDVIGIGYAAPVAEDSLKGGISFGGEVRYNILDNLSLGLGGDMNLFDLEDLDDSGHGTISSSFTTSFTTDYYFSTTSSKRAFAGLGFAVNVNGDIEVPEDNETNFIEGESGMSLTPRIGYELGHARFLVQYNIGLKEELYNYISFRVALTLWGGYKG